MSKTENKTQKEILTAKNIKHDLKGSTMALLIATAVLLIISIVLLRIVFFTKLDSIEKGEFWFLTLLVCSATVSTLVATVCLYQRRRKFQIVTDRLKQLNIERKKVCGIPKEPKFNFVFETNGEYVIHEQLYGAKNYRWSSLYKMSNTELYEGSDLDDEFYIITSNAKKPKILLIYNTKYFELEQN